MTPKPTTNANPMTAPELEQAVLGALLLEADAFHEVRNLLTPDTFADAKNREVYRAIEELGQEGAPIDLLTTTEKLREKKKLGAIGGPAYLARLTTAVASSANIQHHALLLRQKQMRREIARLSDTYLRKAGDPSADVFETLEDASRRFADISADFYGGTCEHVAKIAPRFAQWAQETRSRTGETLGLSTGIKTLDGQTTGLRAPDLWILAARPGMGKTALALNMVRQVCREDGNVAVFSLEMSADQLLARLVSLEGNIEAEKMRDPKRIPTGQWAGAFMDAIERIGAWSLFIDDTAGEQIAGIMAKARKLHRSLEGGLDLVIVDYLQLINTRRGQFGNREQEVSYISRKLKELAKELEVPVIALSQLSRAVELRGGDKRPRLSDLRESGAIEQDADIVAFLYRPEYYKIREDDEGNSTAGLAEIIIGKNRHGATGEVVCRFDAKYLRFTDNNEEAELFLDLPDQTPF